MEVESLEFTLEDILHLHRGWITKVFLEERKTEVEIVELLYEHHLTVSCDHSSLTPKHFTKHWHRLEQIRKCLREWDLLSTGPPPSSVNSELRLDVHSVLSTPNPEPELDIHSVLSTLNPGSELDVPSHLSTPNPEPELGVRAVFLPAKPELNIDAHSVSDGWELIHPHLHSTSPSPSHLSASSNQPDSPTYTSSPVKAEFDRPGSISVYKELPSPSLPPSSSRHKRKPSGTLDRPNKDKLKVTCHHNSRSYEVEMTLGIIPQGQSPIERYASDDQPHERIAVGLKRRAGEATRHGTERRYISKVSRKRVREEKSEEKDGEGR